MEPENKIYSRDEIYRILTAALIQKTPLPPAGWSVAGLDEEVFRAGKEYEPDSRLRHKDALETAVFYLVDFAVRMPERVNLRESNARVNKMCAELAEEIEKITVQPEEVILKRGKLKVWLKAILAVQTCLIYREETERFIAEEDEAKRKMRVMPQSKNSLIDSKAKTGKWESSLAEQIFRKAVGESKEQPGGQPNLF